MDTVSSRNYLEILSSGRPGSIVPSTLGPALKMYPVTEVRKALATGFTIRLDDIEGEENTKLLQEKLSGYLSDLDAGKEIEDCYGVRVPKS